MGEKTWSDRRNWISVDISSPFPEIFIICELFLCGRCLPTNPLSFAEVNPKHSVIVYTIPMHSSALPTIDRVYPSPHRIGFTWRTVCMRTAMVPFVIHRFRFGRDVARHTIVEILPTTRPLCTTLQNCNADRDDCVSFLLQFNPGIFALKIKLIPISVFRKIV